MKVGETVTVGNGETYVVVEAEVHGSCIGCDLFKETSDVCKTALTFGCFNVVLKSKKQ